MTGNPRTRNLHYRTRNREHGTLERPELLFDRSRYVGVYATLMATCSVIFGVLVDHGFDMPFRWNPDGHETSVIATLK